MVALDEFNDLKDWKSADKALGDRSEKKIGNNTWLRRFSNEHIVVLLHGNRVVKYETDGTVRISDGGYKSDTTKDRLNRYTKNGVSVVQRDFDWHVKKNGKLMDFSPAMEVYKGRGKR